MRYLTALALVLLGVVAPAMADEQRVISRGRILFAERGCSGCHAVGAVGGLVAPDLTHIGSRFTDAEVGKFLRDPATHKQIVHTQVLLNLNETELDALAAYLTSLK
jgi:cytochrome c oxidase subunit 2